MLRLAVVLTAVISVGFAISPSPGGSGRPGFQAFQDTDATVVLGQVDAPATVSAAAAETPAQRAKSQPKRARLVLPACGGNELPGDAPADVLCTQATDLCAGTPDPDDRMYWIYTGPPGVPTPTPSQWVPSGQACLSPQLANGQAAVPVVTAEDFRRLPLPAGRVRVQPGSGRTLLNVPTNVYVEAEVATIPTTVLGAPVRVRATPQEYDWSFGDGGRLRTRDAGAPYPDLRTTHVYTVPGSVRLTLTTVYSGEYSVAGGPWLPIAGTASVDSPAQPLTVVAARAELVDDTVSSA